MATIIYYKNTNRNPKLEVEPTGSGRTCVLVVSLPSGRYFVNDP